MSNKNRSAVTARKGVQSAVRAVSTITDKLSQAASFLKESREVILKAPVAKMSQNVIIASFCILKRLGSLVDRRLSGKNGVRERIDEIVALKLPDMEPGELEQRLPAHGLGMAIIRRNKAASQKVMNQEKLEALLDAKKIKHSSCLVRPEAPPPYYGEHLVQDLVKNKKISAKEYESIMEFAPPKPELHVEVPDELDSVLGAALLRG